MHAIRMLSPCSSSSTSADQQIRHATESSQQTDRLEHKRGTLRLLVTTVEQLVMSNQCIKLDVNVPKFEVLASLQRQLQLSLAGNTF